jgi:DNA-binding MarR family transcriptional regulator
MTYNIKLGETLKTPGMSTNADKKSAAGELAAATANDARTPAIDIGPLAGMIGYALRRAQLAVFDDVIANFAELDLRPAQYSVLVLLGHAPGAKQSDVAAALGIQRANFVVLFDGLERRGLARRSAAPNDRRSYALYLTEEGEKVLARANELESRHEQRLDAKLGPEGRARLLALLGKLAERG